MNKNLPTDAEGVAKAVIVLQGKWKIHILWAMKDQPIRLGRLQKLLPHASKKALTAALKGLVADDIAIRRDMSGTILHVEYEFAEGKRDSMIALLEYLAGWASERAL